jgi:purine-binding chemotaxis protein CheW
MTAFAGLHGQKAAMQVLTLALHGETYALEARHVREILDPVSVTDVPGAPRELNGLINVRGKVVPLLDLCLKLGLRPSPPTIDTRFIVVEAPVAGTPTVVGVRADRVYEMAELAADALEETPQIGMRVRGSFVRCIGKRAGEFVIVLDLEALLRIEQAQPGAINRRQHKRLKVSLACSIDIGDQTVQAKVADLSEGGAMVSGFPSQPHGNQGQIRIEGVADRLTFRVIDFRDGAIRMKFEPGGTPSLVAMVRRLEESAGETTPNATSRQNLAAGAMQNAAPRAMEKTLVNAD